MTSSTTTIEVEVEVFDGNPAESGPCRWDQTYTVALSEGSPYVTAAFYIGENAEAVRKLEAEIRRDALACGGYSRGDHLWWRADAPGRGRVGRRMTV